MHSKASSSVRSSLVEVRGTMSRSGQETQLAREALLRQSCDTLVDPPDDKTARAERRRRGNNTPPLSRLTDDRPTDRTCERCTAPYTINKLSRKFNRERLRSWLESNVSDSSADDPEPTTACGDCWDKSSAVLQNSAKPPITPSAQATGETSATKVNSDSGEADSKSSTDPSGP
jgi:hypothetical protein